MTLVVTSLLFNTLLYMYRCLAYMFDFMGINATVQGKNQ